MADNKKISELTAATALTGAEVLEVVQGGANKKTTTQEIADLGAGGGGTVTSVTGTTNRVTSSGGATPVIDIDAAYDAAIVAAYNAAILAAFRLKRTVTGTGASVQSDDNKLIIFNSATPFNFTLDQLTADTKISFINYGAGVVTFVNGSGVTAAGNLTLPAAAGTSYPSAAVIYDTLTTPRVIQGAAAGSGAWGGITGTLSAQTDLQTALNTKENITSVDRQAVALSAGTLTLNINSLRQPNFDLTTTVSANFTFAAPSNATNWVRSRLTLRVTGTIVISFPSTYRMDAFELSNGRWNSSQQLTLTGVTASPFMIELVPDGSIFWVFATNRGL